MHAAASFAVYIYALDVAAVFQKPMVSTIEYVHTNVPIRESHFHI